MYKCSMIMLSYIITKMYLIKTTLTVVTFKSGPVHAVTYNIVAIYRNVQY